MIGSGAASATGVALKITNLTLGVELNSPDVFPTNGSVRMPYDTWPQAIEVRLIDRLPQKRQVTRTPTDAIERSPTRSACPTACPMPLVRRLSFCPAPVPFPGLRGSALHAHLNKLCW